jgi:hypothetical protein
MPQPPVRLRGAGLAALALAIAWLIPAGALAADEQAGTAAGKREFNIIPVAGGDSDIGIAVGQLSSLARLKPGPDLYNWRLESGTFISFKLRDEGIVIPVHDYYLQLTLRDLGPGGRVRLDVRGSYTGRSTLKFYGIGNASPEPPPTVSNTDKEYGSNYPEAWVRVRVRLRADFELHVGSVSWYDWLDVRPNSILAMDAASGPPDVRRIIGPLGPHAVQLFELGLFYDSRDNEIVTRRGAFHTLTARFSPALADWTPFSYQQVNASTRFYATLVPRWLIVSWRLVGDVLLGQPPFYELARFEEASAIGGAKGVRGVPAERYYGKVKVFQNLEVRSEVLRFYIKGKQYTLGAAGFFDAGRVWTELGRAHPELDGAGIGLKYGVGGGLRLHQGETFVVRGDVAWSPDAKPVAGYFAAGQIF